MLAKMKNMEPRLLTLKNSEAIIYLGELERRNMLRAGKRQPRRRGNKSGYLHKIGLQTQTKHRIEEQPDIGIPELNIHLLWKNYRGIEEKSNTKNFIQNVFLTCNSAARIN